MKPKRGLVAMGAFMVLFPATGLIIFWRDGHARVERSGMEAIRREVGPILETWDKQRLLDDGTLSLRQSDIAKQFEEAEPRLGAFRSLSEWKVRRVWAGSRDDMVWQFVHAEAEAVYEKGPATVTVTIARRTMAPEWRIEQLRLGPSTKP